MNPSLLLAVLSALTTSSTSVSGSTSNGITKGQRVNRLKSSVSVPPVSTTVGTLDTLETVETVATGDNTVAATEDSTATTVTTATSATTAIDTTTATPIEERRIQVFHGLFAVYEAALGRYASPGVIEWNRVNVANWPEHINKSDMSAWSEEDVEFLQVLLDSQSIEFRQIARGKRNPTAPLILGGGENNSGIEIEASATVGKKRGRSASALKASATAAVTEEVKNETVASDSFESDSFESDSSESEPLHSISSYSSDEESEKVSVQKANKKASMTAKKVVGRSSRKQSKTEHNFKCLKVESAKPAKDHERQELLQRVLHVYRATSGHPDATEIDWTLLKVIYLQNHALPFSTGLESEGDLLTLSALLKHKEFEFYNMTRNVCRRNRIYERLYRLYADAVGSDAASPFFVKWNEVEISGWPAGVVRSYATWKLPVIEQMEALLDSNSIKFTPKGTEDAVSEAEPVAETVATSKIATVTSAAKPLKKRSTAAAMDYSKYFADSSDSSESETIEVPVKKKARRIIIEEDEEEGKSANVPVSKSQVQLEVDTHSHSRTQNHIQEAQAPSPIQVKAHESFKARVEQDLARRAQPDYFSFKDESSDAMEGLLTALTGVMEEVQMAKANELFASSSRHQRIFKDILKGLTLIQAHAQGTADAGKLSLKECIRFVNSFQESLKNMDPSGEMTLMAFKSYILNRTKFHARLAGIEYKRGDKILDITADRLRNPEAFQFLLRPETRWNAELEFLEFSLDNEDEESIFI